MTTAGAPVNWVSFTDDDNTTWLFDLTFLTSGWSCTFGSTCQGTEPGDNGARGCCAHGAHIVDEAEKERVIDTASRLTDEQWENRALVVEPDDLFEESDGAQVTRLVDDACVFLNQPGFAGGHGCALHIGAVEADERPLDWKPTVCWQVPFRLEEYEDGSGTRTVAVRAWRRSDWGDGGADFGWWCTDDLPEPNLETRDITWVNHQAELAELVGEMPMAMLIDYLVAAEAPVSIGRRPAGENPA